MIHALRIAICGVIGIVTGILIPVQPFSMIVAVVLAITFMIITKDL